MQLLFYEGATNTVTTGLAYVIPNETAELKTKLLYLFFALDYAYSYSLWNRPLVISNYKLIKLKSSFRILISVPIVGESKLFKKQNQIVGTRHEVC